MAALKGLQFTLLTRLLMILALSGCMAWIVTQPSFEAAVATLTALGALLSELGKRCPQCRFPIEHIQPIEIRQNPKRAL